MKGRRRMYRPRRRRAATVRSAAERVRAGHAGNEAVEPLSLNFLRTVVCGGIFVVLVALKLLLPDSMATARGVLAGWLVKDADFVSAFSAVGHAVSGEGGVIDSLEDAYVAVFGEQEATEVSNAAEIAESGAKDPDAEAEAAAEARDYPARAAAEQHVLGFDYAPPLKGVNTSGFGWREDPNTRREAFHYGVDIGAEEGTEIDCFADGTVGVVAESVELGKYLTVHHPNGIVTLYGHCSRITVSSGDAVRLGEKLAEVGSTGNATGPHLHFEIHDGEEYLDPKYYLS